MTGLVDARPRPLTLLFRPGTTLTVDLAWPAGQLDGRTFTSTLGDQDLDVTIAGDVMSLEAAVAVTDGFADGTTADWALLEDLGGPEPEPVLVGEWVSSLEAAATQAVAVVTDASVTVAVSVFTGGLSTAALAAHEADDEAHGDPLGALATHEADTAAHGNPTGQLTTHAASTTAHGNPLAVIATHEADDTAHGDPLGALQLHRDTLHIPHVTVPAAWGTWWQQARDEADTRIVRVQVWSDSIGAGSSATNPLTEGWVELVGAELQDLYGDAGTGYLPWWRATTTGTWTSGIGFGGGQGTASAAATLTFSTLRGTEIRFWYQGLNVTGSFRWRVDGGSWNTVTTPSGILNQSAVTVTGLADTAHTFEAERLSGSVVAYGLEARRTTGVIMQRCAHSGRAMGDYSPVPLQKLSVGATNLSTTITSTAPGAFTSSLVGRYITSTQIFNDTSITAVASATSATISRAAGGTGTSQATISVNPGNRSAIGQETIAPAFGLIPGLEVPDVVILLLGANDGANADYDERTWLDGAANLLRSMTNSASLTYSPDLIVGIEHFGTWFDTNQNVPAMAAAMADFAVGNGGALVDIWGSGRRSWNYWDDLGYFADQIHPNTAGHVQYATPFINLLTS